jgi:hypothetical protein
MERRKERKQKEKKEKNTIYIFCLAQARHYVVYHKQVFTSFFADFFEAYLIT